SVSGYDFWQGIEFYNSNDGKDSSYMKYCIVDNIDKTTQKASMEGSISAISSLLSISYCDIQNNTAYRGGGLNFNSCGVNLFKNNIINNDAKFEGGGIYINNNDANELFETIIEKNLIKDNIVSEAGSTILGGGGIAVVDPLRYTNVVRITENDIISNGVYSDGSLSGAGGGINVFAAEYMELQIVGNKIMYNQAYNAGGGWIQCSEVQDFNLKNFVFSNNIVSNNSGYYYGGLYFNTGKLKNPIDLKFFNNNFVNNLNTDIKTGVGGLYIAHNGNYFQIKNSIFWDNKKNSEPSDIQIEPSVGYDKFTSFCNSTIYMEGQGNISSPSLFNRVVEGFGATPYINYLRGDYHLALGSPCIDKGDPNIAVDLSLDPTIYNLLNSPPNIGAWGLTDEYTTSKYETLPYEEGMSIFVEPLQTVFMDCSGARAPIKFDEIIIADGGKLFINPNDFQHIGIINLQVGGQKIGDEYTSRFEKYVGDQETTGKFENYILDIDQMNCTGVELSGWYLNITSDKPLTLNDSKVYIKKNDPNVELTECGIDIGLSLDFTITNNIIANFDTGIYSPPIQAGKASRRGRITNNVVSFDPSESQKRTGKNTGISVTDTDAEIDNNEIINPDDGIEASQSSGRITNNTVSFDPSESQKQKGADKKGIYILNNSNMEVTSNLITSNDTATLSISGIEVENSSVVASYNVIDFIKYDSKFTYYGFYTTGLGSNSQFINNTINNATYGFYNVGSANSTDFINNIVWGNDLLRSHDVYSDSKILVAYNNNILGTIYEQGLLDSKDNFEDEPLFKSVRISDFNLDKSSKSIDAGFLIKDFHELGVNFYGDKPDVGALEYYVAVITDLNSPTNVNISTSGSLATISWNSVTNANSYKIYQSTDPYGTFSFVKSTSSTSWSATMSSTKYFYYIIASTDAAKSIVEDIKLDTETIKIVKPKKKIRQNIYELSNR
nr:right-handed parallel beta-helix repeat-containing protein [Candidatus Delongbacteria bacterium]